MKSCSDEIDSELLLYTNNLMQREYKRALGPTAPIPSSFPDPTSPDNNNDDDDSSDEIDGELLGSTGAQVIQVLRMIYNRLLVESKMKQNNNIRVLAKAMNTNDAQVKNKELLILTNSITMIFIFLIHDINYNNMILTSFFSSTCMMYVDERNDPSCEFQKSRRNK